MRQHRIPCIVLMASALLVCMANAQAQWSGSVSLLSDYRYRGVSYSDDKPNAQAALAYDGRAGGYSGVLLTQASFGSHRSAMAVGYVGQVVSLTTDLDAEFGLTLNRFPEAHYYDDSEAYVGLLGERWSARLHYSPDYFGSHQHTVYASLALNQPVSDRLKALLQLGALNAAGGPERNPHGPTRLDLRLGAALHVARVDLELSWIDVSRGGTFSYGYETQRQTWVLGARMDF